MTEFKQLEEVLDSLRSEMGFTYKKLPGRYDPIYWIKFDYGSIDDGDRYVLQVSIRFRCSTTKENIKSLIRQRVKDTVGSSRLPL